MTKLWSHCLIFLYTEAVDALMYAELVETREEGVEIGEKLRRELRMFKGISGEQKFKDNQSFYRMRDTYDDNWSRDSIKGATSNEFHAAGSQSSMGDLFSKSTQVDEKALTFIRIVDTRERTYHLKKYADVLPSSTECNSKLLPFQSDPVYSFF